LQANLFRTKNDCGRNSVVSTRYFHCGFVAVFHTSLQREVHSCKADTWRRVHCIKIPGNWRNLLPPSSGCIQRVGRACEGSDSIKRG
jgi:hypothetical protein